MNHLKAIILKFFMLAIVLLVVLTLFFNVEIMDSIWTALVLTFFAYVLGDLLLFRMAANRSGQTIRNLIATIGDVVIAFLTIWFMLVALTDANENLALASLISAIAIGAGEWVFHLYLDKYVFKGRDPVGDKVDEVSAKAPDIVDHNKL